jgi:DNA-binding CsgD family transcriptional regulator
MRGRGTKVAGVWPKATFDRIVTLAYQATTEPEAWTEVLQRVGEAIRGTPVAIHVHGIELAEATTIGSWALAQPVNLKHYAEYYVSRNVWLQHGAHLLVPGAVLNGDEMCSDEILLRSEYYNDFLRPLDVRYSIRAVLTSEPEPLSYLSAGRGHAARPFGEAEKQKLAALVPHLSQAVRIQERLETIQSRRRVASGAIERLPLGVFFLDARGRVVEMNSAARKIVETKDGLLLHRGTLAAIDTKAEVQLQRMIFGAAAARTGKLLQYGGAFSLPRADGRHPLSAMVAPTGATGIFPASRLASVVVLVEEPVRRSTAPFDAFTGSYGLSPAEASLTARLVGGMSVSQAAVAGGIRPSTARSHLKKIFAKTGARRQSDLVRRVLTYDPGHGGEA